MPGFPLAAGVESERNSHRERIRSGYSNPEIRVTCRFRVFSGNAQGDLLFDSGTSGINGAAVAESPQLKPGIRSEADTQLFWLAPVRPESTNVADVGYRLTVSLLVVVRPQVRLIHTD